MFNGSNDFGLPTAALVLGLGGYFTHREGFSAVRFVLAAMPAAAVSVLSVGMLATGGHWFQLLHYNFVDVRHDQWWFFGPSWDPGYRLLDLKDIAKFFVLPFPALSFADRINFPLIIGLGAVGTSIFIAVRTRAAQDVLLAGVGLGLLGGLAVVDGGGSIVKSYGLSLGFWSLLALGAWSLRALARRLIPSNRVLHGVSAGNGRRYAPAVIAMHASALLAALAIAGSQTYACWSDTVAARRATDRFFVPELDGWLPAEWRPYVETVRQSASNRDVIEEYWGLWSAITGAHGKAPVDSVMHALGSIRGRLQSVMQDGPLWVVTTLPAEGGMWWSWNVSASWGFYERVIENYEPVATSPRTIVWRRRSRPAETVRVSCTAEPSPSPHLVITAERPGYYAVHLRYAMRPPPAGRTLLLVHNHFNAAAGGDLSLDPAGESADFPVAAESAGETIVGFLDARTLASPSGDDLRLGGCDAKRVEVPDLFPPPGLPKDSEILAVDEGAFGRGVDAANRTVLLPYSSQGVRRLVPGTAVCLADHQRRVIR